jgi:hypothetical protein
MKNNDRIDLLRQYEGYNYPSVETRLINYITYYFVPINIEEIPLEDGKTLYKWEYIDLRSYDYNYKGLIKALVWRKYDLSDTIAIMLNYMYDPKNKDYKKEFEDLQAWRKQVKDFAKKHFNV